MHHRQTVFGQVELTKLHVLEAILQIQPVSTWRALQVDGDPEFIRQINAPFEEQTTCTTTRIGWVSDENLQN